MFGIGAPELILIIIIILLLFGGKKLPELSRSVGEAIKQMRKGMQMDSTDTDVKPKTTPKE